MGKPLKILIPYGRASAQHHFAYGNREGDVTLCGRDCYGWSFIRELESADMDSAYSCAHCLRKVAK